MKIFVDMDGPLVDFEGYCEQVERLPEIVKKENGAYKLMQPHIHGIEAVRQLIAKGFDVWILSKPPTGNASAWGDKAAWIIEHLPELERKLILSHDKSLVGSRDDWLIDDRPHKANCALFRGFLWHFDMNDKNEWPKIVDYFVNIY